MTSAKRRLLTGSAVALTAIAAALALAVSLIAARSATPTLVSMNSAARQDQPAAALATALRWARCGSSVPSQFQCATTKVPLDYQHPTGRKILFPKATSTYANLANSEDQKYPGFGRLITYDMTPCCTWPAMHTDAYDGPWNRSRTTILVINASHDPQTPIWGAAAVSELRNARLLTVEGDGHTSMYVEPSACRNAVRQPTCSPSSCRARARRARSTSCHGASDSAWSWRG